MNCDRVLQTLDEFFDGELSADEGRMIDEHVRTCSDCRREMDLVNRERTLLLQYRRPVDEVPDLWTAIEARIATEQSTKADHGRRTLSEWLASLPVFVLVPRWGVALALGVLFVATATFVYLGSDRDVENPGPREIVDVKPGPGPGTVAPSPSQRVPDGSDLTKPTIPDPVDVTESKPTKSRALPRGSVETPAALLPLPGDLQATEDAYLHAISVLMKDVEKGWEGAPPEYFKQLSQPLESLDKNIAAARLEVQRNPDDTETVHQMLAAYEAKVDVLQYVSELQMVAAR